MKRALFGVSILAGVVGFGWWLYFLASRGTVDVLQPSGLVADNQKTLILFTIALSALVVVPVFVLLFTFATRYRADNPRAKYRPEWSENRTLEKIWWGIPIVIIALLAGVTWASSVRLDPYRAIESNNAPIEVDVVALQWKWLFIYPKHQVAAVNQMPIPVDTPIKFRISADAPMSAFWVPALGSQIYAMNGMTSQLNLMANKSGTYKGYSTNINGEGYADMVFDVKAMQRRDFDQWMTAARDNSETIDFEKYQALAEPSIEKQPHRYALADKMLYEKITTQYIGHGLGAAMDQSSMNNNSTESTAHEYHGGNN